MKKILSIIFISVIMVIVPISVSGYNTANTISSNDKVFDLIGVLDESEIADINVKVDDILKEEYVDVLFFLTEGGESSEITQEEALEIYNDYGYGMGPTNNGIIVIYEENTSNVELMTIGSSEYYLNEDDITSLNETLTSYFSDGYYYDGIISFIDETKIELNENITKGNPNKIVDDADLLTEEDEQEVLKNINSAIQQVNMDIAVVTVKSTNGVDIMEYTDGYYDYNHYGTGEEQSGILLVIAIEDRNYWISTKGEAIGLFSSEIDSINSTIEPSLTNGEYVDTCNTFTNEVVRVVVNPFTVVDFLIALAIGVVIAIIICVVLASQLKSVKKQNMAQEYVRDGSFKLENSRDIYLYKTVTSVDKSSSSDSGSHTSSSGSSHGGGGGKF